MNVVIVKIQPLYPTRVALQWELEDVSESGAFTFSIERSGAPAGPWTVVQSSLAGVYVGEDPMDDEESNMLSLSRDIYYRVKAVPPSGLYNAVYSPIVNLDALVQHEMLPSEPGNPERPASIAQLEPDPNTRLTERPKDNGEERVRRRLYKRKMLRDLYLSLKHLNGVEYALLKRRHFGTRCAACYDPITRTVLASHCLECFGTSWVGGYFDPIYILGRRLVSQVQSQLTQQDKTDINIARIQVLDYPRIDDGDLLVERFHNRRFLVKQRYETSLKTITVHQTLTVSELSRVAVEYKVQVDL